MRSMILLADIEARLAELEGAVNAFEAMVADVEREAGRVGLRLRARYGMPANNLMLVLGG